MFRTMQRLRGNSLCRLQNENNIDLKQLPNYAVLQTLRHQHWMMNLLVFKLIEAMIKLICLLIFQSF